MQHKLTLIDALGKYSKKEVMMAPLNERTKKPHNFCYLKTGREWLDYWMCIDYSWLYKDVYILKDYSTEYYFMEFVDYAL